MSTQLLDTEKDIYARYCGMCKQQKIEPIPFMDFSMTLFFANEQHPIEFDRLLQFRDFDFAHDVFGMIEKMDRRECKLTGCFVPRSAR